MKTTILLALAVISYAVVVRATSSSEPTASLAGTSFLADDELLTRFLQSDQPRLTSYRARRRLEAAAMGGRLTGSIEAWTSLDPDGHFHFEIIREEGSGLIREHVLRKALETEQQTHNERGIGQIELTRANYDFRVDAAAGEVATIGLLPRRRTPMLLEGTVTVTRQDGDLVRIDGRPSETPSWWTRRVDIVCRYARMNGTRVPVEMSSRADVRLAGDSTFLMTYDYEMINGRSFAHGP